MSEVELVELAAVVRGHALAGELVLKVFNPESDLLASLRQVVLRANNITTSGGDFEQPQPRSGNYDHLSNHTNTDGTWVLEIVTQTPFNRAEGEVLLQRTFSLQRIKTRGQISTAETGAAN